MVQLLTLGVGGCWLVLMTLHTPARWISPQFKLDVKGNEDIFFLKRDIQITKAYSITHVSNTQLCNTAFRRQFVSKQEIDDLTNSLIWIRERLQVLIKNYNIILAKHVIKEKGDQKLVLLKIFMRFSYLARLITWRRARTRNLSCVTTHDLLSKGT